MPKIYETKGFPNPARIRIAIAEKGVGDKISFVDVDLTGLEQRKPAFLAKNPNGTVPMLELDDGTCISECSAITEYLDHATGEPTLTGKTGKERGVIAMMDKRAEAGLFDPVATYFHHATPGMGKPFETYQNKDWGLKNRDKATETMRYLDGVLAKQDYLTGPTFTVADITAFAGLNYAEFAKIEIPADLKNLAAWRARVAARPSVMNA